MRNFCTYFDSNYLLRGLTLYRSLEQSGCEFKLHVVALDDRTYSILSELALPGIIPLPLADLEAWEPALLQAKSNRGQVEYYFTLSPLVPLYVFTTNPAADVVTYLDADLYFYQSPEPIFKELGNQSILVTEHRFPERLRGKEKFGRYNVQYQSFRRDEQGLACLARWKDQCLEWCYDRLEDGKFADQKYLEEWPTLYDRLVILSHKGAGVAPWNWATYPMQLIDGEITIDGSPLIFYHFHGVKIFHPHFISNGLLDFGLMPFALRRWIYAGYLRQIRATHRWLEAKGIKGIAVKDKFQRGGRSSVATLVEIMRKAWAQGMIVF